jgi:hypothetical protein
VNLSTAPPKSGAKMKTAPSPAAARRMTTAYGPLVRVGQKNGAVVREYVGYARLAGLEEQALLAAVNTNMTPLLNYFIPVQKLKSKTRVGSKEIKVCGEPRSPFQRLIESEDLPQASKNALMAQCALYNQVELQQNVTKASLRLRHRLAQANRLQTQKQH